MRRAEVVIGAVSARHLRLHEDAHRALRRPHGMELIAPKVDGGIDIGALAAPKAYAQPEWGFSTAYRADEPQLRRCAQGSFTEAAAMHFSCTSGTPFVYFSCTGIDGCGLDGQRGR
jgi:hypothetical protein